MELILIGGFVLFAAAVLALMIVGGAGVVLMLRGRKWPGWFKWALGGAAAMPLAVVGVCWVLLAIASSGLPHGSDRAAFDSAKWRAADGDEWRGAHVDKGRGRSDVSVRQEMIKDLVENVLPGKTKEEIAVLLGPSVQTGYFSSKADRDFIYTTGPERTSIFAIDSEWLLIWVGEDGRFARYELLTD